METDEEDFDVVVVGAGAAGAVLAARLGDAGLNVLVLESGQDPMDPNSQVPGARDLQADYHVPAFHAFSSENPGMDGDVWVRHYEDTEQQKRDWKYRAEHDGVLYPRVSGLGGCASHHAMIIIKPNDRDWNHIAQVTGDPTWAASQMQKYWEKVERCRHRWWSWRWLFQLTGWNPTGHGWWGWMQTEWAFPLSIFFDWALRRDIIHSVGAAADTFAGHASDFEVTRVDPNARRVWKPHASGVRIPPMSTKRHTRTGARERLLQAARRPGNGITIRLGACVHRLEILEGNARAVLYEHDGKVHRVQARQIVLACGTFRSPQVLLASGVGPTDRLKDVGIAPVHDLPGVGSNLQDRYELGVANEMTEPWRVMKGVEYSTEDKPYRRWKKHRRGSYTSNGSLFAAELKSKPELTVPDLFCFSLLVNFQGYYPGYSEDTKAPNYLTWAILKAYTKNQSGTVRLRSKNPSDPLDVQFRYFDEGEHGWQDDLDAMVTGVKFVRQIADSMGDHVAKEAAPGRTVSTDQDIGQYVKDNAWGHHACGTCAMKPRAENGVVDSKFRVHGIDGLRVVDASVFPMIPGYFIVSAVYMIAEKAAEDIISELS